MNDDCKGLSGEEILDSAHNMAARLGWDNLHDEEDAAQDAALVMVVAQSRARENGNVPHFQRKSGKGAVLTFYAANNRRRKREFLSLTKRIPGENRAAEFIDIIPEQPGSSYMERLEAVERDISLDSLVSTLPEQEGTVIRLRFFQEMTLARIGEEMGITAERARQIEANALIALREKWETAQR